MLPYRLGTLELAAPARRNAVCFAPAAHSVVVIRPIVPVGNLNPLTHRIVPAYPVAGVPIWRLVP